MVPVRDIDIHPRDHDLIVGTHGRGIYILDDLTPLRDLTSESPGVEFCLATVSRRRDGDRWRYDMV